MSMPYGETTGRSKPCSTCGAGPAAAPTHPWMHRLVAVEGDATINEDKNGGYRPVGPHLIIGFPITYVNEQVLMWVKDVAFHSKPDGSDGLEWAERVNKHNALLVATTDIEGFKHVPLVWVDRDKMKDCIASLHNHLPSELYYKGEWFNLYGLVADGDWIKPPYYPRLDFAKVRKEMRLKPTAEFAPWFLPSLDGYEEVPPPPAPPVLQPLSAEAVPLGLLKMDDVALPLPKLDRVAAAFGKPLFKPLRAPDFAAVEQQVEAAKNKWVPKIGDGVRWTVANHTMLAHVVHIGGAGNVMIQLCGGAGAFRDFQNSFLCPLHMAGWKCTSKGQLWINTHKPMEYGRLSPDRCMIPLPARVMESDPPEQAFVQCANLTPVTHKQAALAEEGTGATAQPMLDSEEESEVWSAFAQYCANEEGITLDDKEGERVLAFFVRMRRKLCAMLD